MENSVDIWRTEDLQAWAADNGWKVADPRDLSLDDMEEAEIILRSGLAAIPAYKVREEWVADFPCECARAVFLFSDR